jgi:phosphoribosylformylglycinamidine synthase
VLVACGREGVLASAHDVSDGGLAQTLVEACLRHDVGAVVTVGPDPFVGLFSESTARVVVAVQTDRVAALDALCLKHEIPVTRLGETTADPVLRVQGAFEVPLAEVRAAWSATLPAAFVH